MMDYDPMSPEVKQKPEQYYEELRDICPVHHHVLAGVDVDRINANPWVAKPTTEFWSVFRYEDCLSIFQSPEVFSSREGPGPERMMALTEEGMLIFADNPAHLRQRRLTNKAFTPRMVSAMLPQIQEIADDVIDGFASRGEAEVLTEFGAPVAIRIVARIVGVDDSRVDDFFRWGNDTIAAWGGDEKAVAQAFTSMQEFWQYMVSVMTPRREALARGEAIPDDVLNSLMTAEEDGVGFTEEELVMACQQFMVAGFETTSTALANGVHLLCTNPGERVKLENDIALAENAVEEVLRFRSPLEGLFRTTNTDTEVGGCPIPAGAKVRIVFASGNCDHRQWPDADEFRIDRDPYEVRRHLSFGAGIHTCVGAALARAELRIALTTLLRRLPGFELHPTKPAERSTILTANGFRSLPISWDPAQIRDRA